MIQTTLFPDTFAWQRCPFSNDDIADMFDQVADLLAAQDDDFYRIRAYRRGAEAVRSQTQPVVEIVGKEGPAGLEKLPHIGRRLALSIEEIAKTGELALLERLLIDVSPEDLFTTVPGIGQVLARRIYRQLGIHTLEALEQAAYDGTLAALPGFGRGRIQLVQAAIGNMLNKSSQQRLKTRRWHQEKPVLRSSIDRVLEAEALQVEAVDVKKVDAKNIDAKNIDAKNIDAKNVDTLIADAGNVDAVPSADLLLEVDEQYRYMAKAGQLRMVTPRRFNPEGKRWLPVMKIKKDGWEFNALFSNTARSHELNKTHDWVVISYYRIGSQSRQRSGQCTIVTETRGEHKGQRKIMRGAIAASA